MHLFKFILFSFIEQNYGFWFLVCYAATQPSNYIRKLHQERIVVVCSNRVARKRPARGFFGCNFLNRHTAIQLQQQRIQVVHTGGANLRDTFFVFVGCSSCDVTRFSQSILLQGGLPRPAEKKKRVCQDVCEKAFEQHRQEHRHTHKVWNLCYRRRLPNWGWQLSLGSTTPTHYHWSQHVSYPTLSSGLQSWRQCHTFWRTCSSNSWTSCLLESRGRSNGRDKIYACLARYFSSRSNFPFIFSSCGSRNLSKTRVERVLQLSPNWVFWSSWGCRN